MPYKLRSTRQKFNRENMRYHRARAAGDALALKAEQAKVRAQNAMKPFYALPKKGNAEEVRRVHAACSAERESATREYRELRAQVIRSRGAIAGSEREEVLREIRLLRAALDKATAKLQALDASIFD